MTGPPAPPALPPPPIKPATVKGVTIPIQVSAEGEFTARVGEHTYRAWTRADLAAQLERAVKQDQAQVSVPFTMVWDGRVVRGVATGIHATSENVLARVNGQARQLRGHERTMDDLTQAEALDLDGLYANQRAAHAAVQAFEKAHAMPLVPAVKAALAEATGEARDA